MSDSVHFFYQLVFSPYFLVLVLIGSSFVKICSAFLLVRPGVRAEYAGISSLLLATALFSSLFGDAAWLLKLFHSAFSTFSYAPVTFLIRVAWGLLVVQYHALALFVYSLVGKPFRLGRVQTVLLVISGCLLLYFLYQAFGNYWVLCTQEEREIAGLSSFLPLEFWMMRYSSCYVLAIMAIELWHVLKALQKTVVPEIVRTQMKTFVTWLLAPYICIDVMQGLFFYVEPIKSNIYGLVALSTLMLIGAVAYCMCRVMRLRFFNYSSGWHFDVQADVISSLKSMIDQLSTVCELEELQCVTQSFFYQEFNIPAQAITVYLRHAQTHNGAIKSQTVQVAEALLSGMSTHESQRVSYISYDEQALKYFYGRKSEHAQIVEHMERLRAALVIPLYGREGPIGAVVVGREAHGATELTEFVCNSMVLFINYLSSSIDLLQKKKIHSFMGRKKQLEDAFYRTHQEIHLYKESIASFLHDYNCEGIGVIFYKKGVFSLANKAAATFITFDPNQSSDHPLAAALLAIVSHVQGYKSPICEMHAVSKTLTIKLSAMPHGESEVLITVSQPGISDVIFERAAEFEDHAQWDWLLYLQATKAGAFVEQQIPGSSHTLLQWKIAVLQAGMSKEVVWIDAAAEDVDWLAGLLSHMRLSESVKVADLEKTTETISAEYLNELCAQMHPGGTIHFKQLHLLDRSAQARLLQLITCGFVPEAEGYAQKGYDVRIICSSTQLLKQLVREESFDPELYAVLRSHRLSLGSVHTLSGQEVGELAHGFARQMFKEELAHSQSFLGVHDVLKLIDAHCVSFTELKSLVHRILAQKLQRQPGKRSLLDTSFCGITDPELLEAARLGKYALKDSQVMLVLYQKFKNKKKIAEFLGVNRSSVGRRLREYGLETGR